MYRQRWEKKKRVISWQDKHTCLTVSRMTAAALTEKALQATVWEPGAWSISLRGLLRL
jgi:hypothetical protein